MCAKCRLPIRTDTSQSSRLWGGGGPAVPLPHRGTRRQVHGSPTGRIVRSGGQLAEGKARTIRKIRALQLSFFSAQIWIEGQHMPCRRSPQNDAVLAGKVLPLPPPPVRFRPSVCERIWHPSRKIEGAPLDLYYRQEAASWVLSLDSRDRRFGPASLVKRISNIRTTGPTVDEE